MRHGDHRNPDGGGSNALIAVRAVVLELHGVPARGVPRTPPVYERAAPGRQRADYETEAAPALGERVRGARRPL